MPGHLLCPRTCFFMRVGIRPSHLNTSSSMFDSFSCVAQLRQAARQAVECKGRVTARMAVALSHCKLCCHGKSVPVNLMQIVAIIVSLLLVVNINSIANAFATCHHYLSSLPQFTGRVKQWLGAGPDSRTDLECHTHYKVDTLASTLGDSNVD